ncbi:MAG: hypothetical protein CR982_03180 [Candidatus Cloacimonadota bacterium]|nr:MAG: hypothetical protein CR982_03180 [Candidatus Cloacimonadota bacterium]PIE77421.1 MAG: hypothetical protein CSA15_13155 [Candidatus Delongbacteria bacterium]
MNKESIINILACPVCKGKVHFNSKNDGVICDKCELYYEIKEEIFILLPESGKPLEPDFL